MAFTFNEFPNASYYNDDLRELIRLYNELIKAYNGLQDEIQDTIDFVNNFEETTLSIITEKINGEIAVQMSLYMQRLVKVENLVAELESIVNTANGRIDDLQNQINSLRNQLYKSIQDLQIEYQNILKLLHQYKYDLENFVDGKVQYLERYIEERVKKIDRLWLINPVTGEIDTAQGVVDSLYEYESYSWGLTAEEYDNLQLSAWEYDQLRITALEYATRAYFIFWQLRQGMMRNPFTGANSHYSNIINTLVNLHKCALTAQEYDNLHLTAKQYEYLGLTAFEYDFFGKHYVPPLTAKRYDDLQYTAENYDSRNITAEEYQMGMRFVAPMKLEGCCCKVYQYTENGINYVDNGNNYMDNIMRNV